MTRTRFAPSPTGYMHIGNLRSALFAYLIAKHDNGEFILRIEDTDQKRKVLGAEEFIYNMLQTFGLEYDEGPNKEGEYGPYIQSKRLDIYKSYAEKLIEKDCAYYCFCEEETLSKERIKSTSEKSNFLYKDPCRNLALAESRNRVMLGEPHCIRQKMPDVGQTSYNDLVYGSITIENNTLEDQIILKSDGYPTYNFANVIDDALMNITHVTRGNEYLSSTPKYLLLYDALGFTRPEFIHLPLVTKLDHTKISKRNKDDNLVDLLNQGFLPAAIINYLAFLGWTPPNNQEFFTLEELVKVFDIKRINSRPSCYDINKLKWYNKHYITQMSDEDYLNFTRPFLEKFYNLSDKTDAWVNHLLRIHKNHISFGTEIALVTNMFFQNDIELDEEAKNFLNSDPSIKNTIAIFKSEIESITNWEIHNVINALNNTKNKAQVNPKLVYMPIRILTTGLMHGVELTDALFLLGKDTILKRLNK